MIFGIFRYIVKLLMVCGESKSGLYTYYIKLYNGNNVYDAILDRIGEIDLIGSYSIDIIGSSRTPKKECQNHY